MSNFAAGKEKEDYDVNVLFEFDDDKDRENQRDHGISLSAASEIFEGPYLEVWDERSPGYGEDRYIAVGLIQGLVFVLVYTRRGESHRFISLRIAERSEADDFYKEFGI